MAREKQPSDRKNRSLDEAIDTALSLPTARVHAYVDAIRRKRPDATPEEVIGVLEKRYLLAVSSSGGAVGAAAALPVIGTGTALALTAGQVAAFLGASSLLALAVADVHGIAVEDAPRRRALLRYQENGFFVLRETCPSRSGCGPKEDSYNWLPECAYCAREL